MICGSTFKKFKNSSTEMLETLFQGLTFYNETQKYRLTWIYQKLLANSTESKEEIWKSWSIWNEHRITRLIFFRRNGFTKMVDTLNRQKITQLILSRSCCFS